MGGPVASVFLREPLTKKQGDGLENWLWSISDHRRVGHIVDVAFFQARMKHPHFYMMK